MGEINNFYNMLFFYKDIFKNNPNLTSNFIRTVHQYLNNESNLDDFFKIIFLYLKNDQNNAKLYILFQLLFTSQQYCLDNLINFLKNNNKYIFLLIQKYLVFIQKLYKDIKIDLMPIISSILGDIQYESLLPDIIIKYNTSGIFP